MTLMLRPLLFGGDSSQKRVKGVKVDSYNAEILSESRKLVRVSGKILGVKLRGMTRELKRLVAAVVFCSETAPAPVVGGDQKEGSSSELEEGGLGGLRRLVGMLQHAWEAERVADAAAPGSSGAASTATISQNIKFSLCLLCIAELQSALNMLVEFLDELSEQLSFWKEMKERPIRYDAVRLVARGTSAPKQLFFQACRIWGSCSRALSGAARRPRASLDKTVRHLEAVMMTYLVHLGKVKNSLIAIGNACSEAELEEALSAAFLVLETIMGVSVLRDSGALDATASTPTGAALETPFREPDRRSFCKSSSHDTFFTPFDNHNGSHGARRLFDHEVVEQVFEHAAEFLDSHDSRIALFRRQIAGRHVPSRAVLYWPELVLGLVTFGGISSFVFKHSSMCGSDDLSKWTSAFLSSVKMFVQEHVTSPVKALVDEVFFDTLIDVADVKAMDDAKASLSRMLQHYVDDHAIEGVDPQQLREAIANCDMGILTKDFEKEMQKPVLNLVSGDLVRLILLNVQFLKKEMLSVVAALDQLIRQNQFNLQASKSFFF